VAAKKSKSARSAKKSVKSGKSVKKVKKGPAKKKAVKAAAPKASKPAVKLGKPVGSFSLFSTGGKEINLAEMKGKNIVLYFYPKDDTPGCTLEGKDFTRLHPDFSSTETEIYGISRDSVESHEKFKNKYCYSIDLLSDEDEKLCRHFGVIRPKNMYGKTVIGIERSTFVIDKDGVLRREWRKVKVDGHAAEVLDFVKTL
jgi:thioredoxin-dependent peroxiredoxin